MAPEMIPMMIDQGFAAIAVVFDVWGFANMVKNGLTQARGFANQVAETRAAAQTNGVETNGKVEANGTAKVAVTANGKATSS